MAIILSFLDTRRGKERKEAKKVPKGYLVAHLLYTISTAGYGGGKKKEREGKGVSLGISKKEKKGEKKTALAFLSLPSLFG